MTRNQIFQTAFDELDAKKDSAGVFGATTEVISVEDVKDILDMIDVELSKL